MAKTGVLEETDKEAAMEIKKQLGKLVRDIVEDEDYAVETAEEAMRALSSLKKLKMSESLSFGVLDVPQEFRCPISGKLMTDPVVLATGQTYDRPFIQRLLNQGSRTCPQTNQLLAHTILTPNNLVHQLISQWCKEHGIDSPTPVQDIGEEVVASADGNYLNALLEKTTSSSLTDQKQAAKELRLLTKRSSSFRALFGESAEIIPQMLSPLSQGQVSTHPDLQEDLITTLLNVSIHDNNKRLVAENSLVIPLLIESLMSGTIQTKSNAAATFFTLSAIDSNKTVIGRSGALKPLINLLNEGNPLAMNDVSMAIYLLCTDLENRERAVNAGAVWVILKKIMDGVFIAGLLTTLAIISTNQKAIQDLCDLGAVSCLIKIIRESDCERNKENCIVIIYNICFRSRSKLKEIKDEEMANGTVSRLAQSGTSRAKRKATGILARLNKTGSITNTA
ncbi:U-box domain-containing protein 9-like [Argentina anserina]|uniref:U-box domain-containing protein 9-like n=1 Tax=Argentina anserina TaxID=57926 RepID=UPI0021762BAE|nr:U-box domain-containing protein 9-like [Potentilla anserina]